MTVLLFCAFLAGVAACGATLTVVCACRVSGLRAQEEGR